MPEDILLEQSPELDTQELDEVGEPFAFMTEIIRDRNSFERGSMVKQSIGNGVVLVLGKLSGDPTGPLMPHALLFQKSLWTPEQAKEWIKAHQGSFELDGETLKKDYAQLFKIPNVEIFAAGTWNGDTFTIKDLDKMVEAFESNKQKFKPFLKLGHDDEQKLLQKEGLPAAGWISRIFRKGDKLLADFVDVPKKIFELIKNKSFRKVSAEIFFNIELNGKKFDRLLSAVALLGAEHPAVSSLDDILGMFSRNQFERLETYTEDQKKGSMKIYEFSGKEKSKMEKSENEIKLEYDLKAAQEELKKFKQELGEIKTASEDSLKVIDELKKAKEDSEEKVKEFELKAAEAELALSVDEFEKEGLATASMKPFIKELISAEKKEYSLGDKTYSKSELLKEVLKLSRDGSVNLEENSVRSKKESDDQDVLESKIQKYMKEHNASYANAYRAVATN